ncbi:MAG: glycosyltransferase, partial [bacterium]
MKICLITNLYPPFTRGGAEEVVRITVGGLISAGHDVVVISTKPGFSLSVEQSQKLKIYRFRPLNLFYYLNDHKHNSVVRLIWHFWDMFNLSSAFMVRKILSNEKPDLVITHNLMGLGFLIPNTIFACGLKHIHVLHDVQLAVPSGLILKGKETHFAVDSFLVKLYARFCRNLFIKVQAVISPSQWLLDFHSQKNFFPKAKTIVILNPISLNQESKQKDVRINKYLFIGQLEKHKGIEWLVDVWEKNNIQSELFIVGAGALKLKVQSEKLKVLGKVEGEEVNKIFAQADFLIVPSLCYENS